MDSASRLPPAELKLRFAAGLYARVPTHDQQTLPMQRRAMRDYAARRGRTIIVEIKELGSGAQASSLSGGYQKQHFQRSTQI